MTQSEYELQREALIVVKSIERIEPERVIINEQHRIPIDQEVAIGEMNGKPFLIKFPDELLSRHRKRFGGDPPAPCAAVRVPRTPIVPRRKGSIALDQPE